MRKRHADRRPDWIRHRGGPRHVALLHGGVPTLREAKGGMPQEYGGHMPGALQGTERTPGDHTGGERAKRDVRPQRGRSRHGHLPFRLRPCRVGRPQATQPDERRQDQGTEDHAREPFPEDRAGAVRMGRGQVPGDQVRPQV